MKHIILHKDLGYREAQAMLDTGYIDALNIFDVENEDIKKTINDVFALSDDNFKRYMWGVLGRIV